MGRPRTAKHPGPDGPDGEGREGPEAPGSAEPGDRPTKAEMVRRAVADGMERPQDGVDWIKARYGVELGKPMWSSYRAQQKAREAKGGGPRRREAVPARDATGDVIDALEALKPLVAGMGAERVKRLVDILG